VGPRRTILGVGLLRRRVAGTLATRIDRAYFGEIRRLVPFGTLQTPDSAGILDAHRSAWQVVRAEVFDGSTPAVMFGSRRIAGEVERAHLFELARLFGVSTDGLSRLGEP
jgi:hypothetical protein